MIRTVLQAGEAGQPTRTIEFDEKQIVLRELTQAADGSTVNLVVTLAGRAEPITMTEPAVIARLWKTTGRKPKKK